MFFLKKKQQQQTQKRTFSFRIKKKDIEEFIFHVSYPQDMR